MVGANEVAKLKPLASRVMHLMNGGVELYASRRHADRNI
jgi:hypothetical protein